MPYLPFERKKNYVVLVLTGVELIFFIVAGMGLSFGFVLETVLIILFLTPPHQQAGWGCTRSWEGVQLRQLTPTDQRDIPYHMMSCSAVVV